MFQAYGLMPSSKCVSVKTPPNSTPMSLLPPMSGKPAGS